MKCMKCGRTGENPKTGVRVARGWEIDRLLCAACYADEYGLKNAMLHFTSREIDMERRRRAKAGCGR